MVNKTLVDALVRASLLTNATIKRQTGSRISPAQLATVVKQRGRQHAKSLQFPCINFETRDIMPMSEMSDASWFPMTLWVWTRNDRDQAHDIYATIVNQIGNERFFDSNVNLVIRLVGDLVDAEDEEASLTGVVSQWIMYTLNRS